VAMSRPKVLFHQASIVIDRFFLHRSQAPLPQASPLGLASASASASAAAAVASGHPLKSFTVPAPPPLSPPLKMVSPPLSVHRPAPSSPYKVAPPPMTTTTTTTAAAAQSPAVLRAHIGQGTVGSVLLKTK